MTKISLLQKMEKDDSLLKTVLSGAELILLR